MARRIERTVVKWQCEHCETWYDTKELANICEAAFERHKLFKALFVPNQLYWYQFQCGNIMQKEIIKSNDNNRWCLGYDIEHKQHQDYDYPYAPKGSCMRQYSIMYNANRGHNILDFMWRPIQRKSLMDAFLENGLLPTMLWLRQSEYASFTPNQKRQIKQFWTNVQKYVQQHIDALPVDQLKELCVITMLQSYVGTDNINVPLPPDFQKNILSWTFQLPQD